MTENKKETEIPRQFDPSIDLDIGNLPKPWTEKQAKFVFALLSDPKRRAGEAARTAGFSEKTADAQASRMLNDVKFSHIQDYINFREQKILDKWAYDHEQHVQSTVRQSRFNIFDFAKPDPSTGQLVIDFREVPYEFGELISSVKSKQMAIKTVEGGEEISLPTIETEVKFWNKDTARDQLNKMMGNYDKDNIRRVIHEGGDKPVEFKTMSMEEAAKAYQESLKDV